MNPNPYVLKSAADTAFARLGLLYLGCFVVLLIVAKIRCGRRK